MTRRVSIKAPLRVVFCAAAICVGCSAGPRSTFTPPPPPAPTPTAYYLDCSQAIEGKGAQSSPWNSLSDANSHTFNAGDSLLLNRGTTCNGILQPKGSGASGSPIVIDAYGTGNLPILSGGSTNIAVVELVDQQYWEIKDLEIVGGSTYGVYITGIKPNNPLQHLYLKNLNVHGAMGVSSKRLDSGEVYISTNGINSTLSDILVDGVTAASSQVSEGILVNGGGGWVGGNSQLLGSNITVQNSTAHDVYGDGILIMELTKGTVKNSVVYNTGLCPGCGSTPSGLWEWWCNQCTIQNNESYANQTWAADGGDFDIDYYNDNNIVQYNYGHDSAGYCVAVFGAESTTDSNSIVRYNVCSNNVRKPFCAFQGEVFLSTWDGGALSGVQIYNNTFYWNPSAPAPLLFTTKATYNGSAQNFFKNNIVYSTVPSVVDANSGMTLDYNIYWVTGGGSPQWIWNGNKYSGLAAFQAASSQEAHSLVVDPLLNSPTSHSVGIPTTAFTLQTGSPALGAGINVCAGISDCTMGTQDFFGKPLPTSGTGYSIGAYQ